MPETPAPTMRTSTWPASWLDLRDACTAFSHRKPGRWRRHGADLRGRGMAGRGGGSARRPRTVRGRGEEGGHQQQREDHDDRGDRSHGQPRVRPRGRGHGGGEGYLPALRYWRGGRGGGGR